MGYLDNSTITVDAILTLKGRELLAQGGTAFNITQFALGDDEVDYSLWNPDHPLGTSYYGTIIENMPVTEAIPDESQALKYRLISLPKNTVYLPKINVGNTTITLQTPGSIGLIAPNTANLLNANSTLGYTAILSDNTIADLQIAQPLANTTAVPTTPTFIGDNSDARSISAVGFQFRIVAKPVYLEDKVATVTIIGNETGGSTTIQVTVKKVVNANA